MDDDIDELGADVRRAVARMYSRFRSERAEGEVPEAALLVLIVLDKRDRMSLTDLAESAKVTLGSMAQTTRWLERAGYVTKSRGDADRRKVLFTLTQQGRAAAQESRRHRQDWLNGRLAGLSAGERAEISRVAALFLRIADS
ncbi:MAG TPA: MarR family transcriptional regulator [Pseudolysinimonas sp.]|nr:MarR family transcriptional regulator [Pseudolysinimonas sp.]